VREIQAAHRRHFDVGQQQVVALLAAQLLHCDLRVVGREHFIAAAP